MLREGSWEWQGHADDHWKERQSPDTLEVGPEGYLGCLARSSRGWGLEPLT